MKNTAVLLVIITLQRLSPLGVYSLFPGLPRACSAALRRRAKRGLGAVTFPHDRARCLGAPAREGAPTLRAERSLFLAVSGAGVGHCQRPRARCAPVAGQGLRWAMV